MNAGRMLARLERATKEKGVKVSEFLKQYGLPISTFYVIKKTKDIPRDLPEEQVRQISPKSDHF